MNREPFYRVVQWIRDAAVPGGVRLSVVGSGWCRTPEELDDALSTVGLRLGDLTEGEP